ncbi:CPBP family glutamic-type intramembrane protease [Microbacterium sp. CCNWLW134]|uniref:CPBP family intramembrane glutamic endopeptidase n=1 Tax=Microbacterium sp. CCNWLW134 TaxID=3122064 RepID=UPI003010482C
MSSVPGVTPGQPYLFTRSYHQPWRALLIAAGGFAAAALLLFVVDATGPMWAGMPGWIAAVASIFAANAPLIIAVAAAAAFTSLIGFARATGIRHWIWTDLLYGLFVGIVARAVVELVAPTLGGFGGPLGGALTGDATIALAIAASAAVLISPIIEELYFRGLLVRALFDALSDAGRIGASIVAVTTSTAAFVLLHVVAAGSLVPVGLIIGSLVVGVGCGVLTVVTGRLWAAIAAHVLYNASGLALLLW